MNPLKPYYKTKTAIHCTTKQQAEIVNDWLVDLGGRNLLHKYNEYESETCFSLNELPLNCYSKKEFYEKTEGYKIIPAREFLLLQVNNHFEIF